MRAFLFIAALLFTFAARGAEPVGANQMLEAMKVKSEDEKIAEAENRIFSVFEQWIKEGSIKSRDLIMRHLIDPPQGLGYHFISEEMKQKVVESIIENGRPTTLPAALAYVRYKREKPRTVGETIVTVMPSEPVDPLHQKVVDAIVSAIPNSSELAAVIRDGIPAPAGTPKSPIFLAGLVRGGSSPTTRPMIDLQLRPNHDSIELAKALSEAQALGGVTHINFGSLGPRTVGDVHFSNEAELGRVNFDPRFINLADLPKLAIASISENPALFDAMMNVRNELTHKTPVTREQMTESLLAAVNEITDPNLRAKIDESIMKSLVQQIEDPYLDSHQSREKNRPGSTFKNPKVKTLLINNNDGADMSLARYLNLRDLLNTVEHILWTGMRQRYVKRVTGGKLEAEPESSPTYFVRRFIIQPTPGKTISEALDPKNYIRVQSVDSKAPPNAFWLTSEAYNRGNTKKGSEPLGSVRPLGPCTEVNTAAAVTLSL